MSQRSYTKYAALNGANMDGLKGLKLMEPFGKNTSKMDINDPQFKICTSPCFIFITYDIVKQYQKKNSLIANMILILHNH